MPRANDDFGLAYYQIDITRHPDVPIGSPTQRTFLGEPSAISWEHFTTSPWPEICALVTVTDWAGNRAFADPVCAPLVQPTQAELDATLPPPFSCASTGGESGAGLLLFGLLIRCRRQSSRQRVCTTLP